MIIFLFRYDIKARIEIVLTLGCRAEHLSRLDTTGILFTFLNARFIKRIDGIVVGEVVGTD